jgi:hypothetical protein
MSASKESPAGRPLRGARLVGLAEYVFRRNDKAGDIYPSDSPSGVVDSSASVDSADPMRIVVIGESNAIGLGVTRHELGMVGHLARLLSARSSRGVFWSAIGKPGLRIHDAWEVIGDNHSLLAHADVVVVMMGIADTLSLTSRSTWTAHMTDTLDLLTEVMPNTARIVITRIPPMDNAGSVSRLARFAAGRQARLFNRITQQIVSESRLGQMVDFPSELVESLWVPGGRQSPYVGMYSAWSASVAEVLVGVAAVPAAAPAPAPAAAPASAAASAPVRATSTAPAPVAVVPPITSEPVPPVPTL